MSYREEDSPIVRWLRCRLSVYLGQGDRKSGTVAVFYLCVFADCPDHVVESVLTITWALQATCCSEGHMIESSSSSPNVALYFWLSYLLSSECLTQEYEW